jgi:phosphomannomutase
MIASDVLYYTLENGDKVVVRPSGTEPKIKFYFLAHGEDADALEAKMIAYKADAEELANV